MKTKNLLHWVILFIAFTHYALLSNPFWQQKNPPNGTSMLAVQLTLYGNRLYMTDNMNLDISTDHGETWYINTDFMTAGAMSIAANDNVVFVGVASRKPVLKSTDFGYNWSQYIEGIGDSSLNLRTIVGIKDDFVFVGGTVSLSRSKISDSTPWEIKENFVDLPDWKKYLTTNKFLIIDDKIFLGMNNIGVWMSSNDGESWHERNNGISFQAIYGLQYFEGFLYASTFGGGICRSNDWGENWVRITPIDSLALQRINAVYVEGNTILAGTNHNGIYISYDFGETWEPEYTSHYIGISDGINSFCRVGDFLFAGSKTYGVIRTEYKNIFNSVKTITESKIKAFPNPANSNLILELKEEFSGKISAVNLKGNEILLWEGYTSGNNLQLDISGLISGQYILILDYGNKKEIIKFVKL